MKTAVSVPDDLFERAERLARQGRKTRSQLFTEALREYLTRHAPDEVTAAMDRVCVSLGSDDDRFPSEAARRILERCEW